MEFWQLPGGYLGTSIGWIWWIRGFLLKSLRKTLESQREAMGLGLGPKYEIRYPQVNWHDSKIPIFRKRYIFIHGSCFHYHLNFSGLQALTSQVQQNNYFTPIRLMGNSHRLGLFALFFTFPKADSGAVFVQFKEFYMLNLRYPRETIRYFCKQKHAFLSKGLSEFEDIPKGNGFGYSSRKTK